MMKWILYQARQGFCSSGSSLTDFCKSVKNESLENECFLFFCQVVCVAASYFIFDRKSIIKSAALCCTNHSPWICGIELVKVVLLATLQATWHGLHVLHNFDFVT